MEVLPHALHKHKGERVTAVHDCHACFPTTRSPLVPMKHIGVMLEGV